MCNVVHLLEFRPSDSGEIETQTVHRWEHTEGGILTLFRS